MIASLLYIAVGLSLIIGACVGRTYFINDIEVPASEDKIQNATPTLAKRIAIGIAGLGGCIYGVLRLLK